MSTKLGKVLADFTTALATKIDVGGTTATLQSATDDDSVALPAGRYFFTIDGSNSQKEHFSCDLSGTSLTNLKSVSRQGVETTGAARQHRIGATVALTDYAHLKFINDLLDGTTNFNASTPFSYDGTASITSANQFATKAYVDATATGSATYDQNIVAGVAGENVTSGNIIYFKASDGKWYIADSSDATKSVGVQLGIVQATALSGAAINVLIAGLDKKQTGLSAGSSYYLSTSGGISTTKGANIRFIGRVPYNTAIQLVVDLTGGNPEVALVDGSRTYVADTGAADAYVLTLVPAISAYKTGQIFSFKATNTNTTTSTVNVNGLGVKTIKKVGGTANLSSGDIQASQLVTIQYDGTNFQMLNPVGNAPSQPKFGGDGSDGALNVTSGTTTISLGSANVVVKNYSSINVSVGATLAFSSPASDGTVIILKSQGAVTIAGTIDGSGMGAAGGAGAGRNNSSGTGADGTIGTTAFSVLDGNAHGGGGASGGQINGGGGAGAAGAIFTLLPFYTVTSKTLYQRKLMITPGSGGGGGAAGYSTTGAPRYGGAGGAGGNGGAAIIVECAGALNFTGTILAKGSAGVVGEASGESGSQGSGGGGGGGGGGEGMVVVLYNTLTANSGTIATDGGNGGTGGASTRYDSSNLYKGGGGGGGGGTYGGAGIGGGAGGTTTGGTGGNGTATTGMGAGGGGGAGANGTSGNNSGGPGGTGGTSTRGFVAKNDYFA